ncbi:MAG: sulfatase family protein [Planctomycetota bacterium]|jgi:arylsulfatase A-like enzyme
MRKNFQNRREFLKAAAMSMAFTDLSESSKGLQNFRSKGDKPNIIFYLTDDQDKVSIGAYGSNAYSPNLDRMAKEGIIFHQAFVSSTVCTPSRYSFLTGRYAGRSYSKRYLGECPARMQGFVSFNMTLEEDKMNVGNVLSENGYVTGYVGKFHVGEDIKQQNDFKERGLKYVDRKATVSKKSSDAFKHNERWYRQYLKKCGFSWAKNIYWGNMNAPFNHHNVEWTTEAALEFIEENKKGPFYLHLCTTLVHGPAGSWRKSMDHPKISGEGLLDELPDVMTDRRQLLEKLKKKGLDPSAGHAGYSWVDDSVGAILKKLDELGIAENTLIVFAGDHGSKMKGSLFHKDGVNIPCIMRWPRGIKAGTECHELIQNIDMVPTYFDLANVQVPKKYKMDGRSLVPLFKGTKPVRWRENLYFEMGNARAVCSKEWKYIAVRYSRQQIDAIKRSSPEQLPKNMAYIGRLGIGTRGASNPNFFDADQLYNPSKDPFELKNLANNLEHRQKLLEMKNVLTKYLQSFDRPFGEFVMGGNAVEGDSIDKQIKMVKQIKISGKKIIVPPHLSTTETGGRNKARKAKTREERRKNGESRKNEQ